MLHISVYIYMCHTQTTPSLERRWLGPGNVFSTSSASGPATMTQSTQTTISLNRHKALGLGQNKIKW